MEQEDEEKEAVMRQKVTLKIENAKELWEKCSKAQNVLPNCASFVSSLHIFLAELRYLSLFHLFLSSAVSVCRSAQMFLGY